MNNYVLQGMWSEWQIVKELGHGSYGYVYEAMRNEHTIESRSAIKVISITSDNSEVQGMTEEECRIYMRNAAEDFGKEIQLMEELKGVQNIVSVEDYKIVERNDGTGWDIYIRMELLTPFTAYISDHDMTEKEIIRLGKDMCTALNVCAQKNIIHRDIKPENIFVNKFGNFKLGDFGIARTLEGTTGNLSYKGTYNYMAPEIYHGYTYDSSVDIYSLGLVLYRLANDNRLPFLDTEKQVLSPAERNEAAKRRLNGEALPLPKNASRALSAVILCACSYYPQDRFRTPMAMLNALNSAEKNPNATMNNVESRNYPPQNAQMPNGNAAYTVNMQGTNAARNGYAQGGYPSESQAYVRNNVQPGAGNRQNVYFTEKKKRGPKTFLLIALLIVVLILALGTINFVALPLTGNSPLVKSRFIYNIMYGINDMPVEVRKTYFVKLADTANSKYIQNYERIKNTNRSVTFCDINDDGVSEMLFMGLEDENSTPYCCIVYPSGNVENAGSVEFSYYGNTAVMAAVDIAYAWDILQLD